MEIKGGYTIKAHGAFQEFVGTALLSFTANMASWTQFKACAIGLILFMQISIVGPTCGGHLNTAVTIGVYVVEAKRRVKDNLMILAVYTVAQVLGAAAGCGLAFLCQRRDVVALTIEPGISLLCPSVSSGQNPDGVICSAGDAWY